MAIGGDLPSKFNTELICFFDILVILENDKKKIQNKVLVLQIRGFQTVVLRPLGVRKEKTGCPWPENKYFLWII